MNQTTRCHSQEAIKNRAQKHRTDLMLKALTACTGAPFSERLQLFFLSFIWLLKAEHLILNVKPVINWLCSPCIPYPEMNVHMFIRAKISF